MAVWLEQSQTLGEVRVEVGTGLIDELKHEPGRRNAHVTIKATHANLRDPITGWVDTADSAVWPEAQQAAAERYEIEYRIETHRKNNVANDKPIAELANRDKVRDCVKLARKGELSQIDRDPPSTSTPEAETAPDDTPGPEPTPPAPQADEQPPRRRPRVEEARPWELYNTDRSLNLASYSYQAVAETVEFAHYQAVKRLAALADAGLEQPEFRMGQVETLARTLLDAADHVQAATRNDGHVDRMDASHRRARYAIRAALALHPVPWGAEPDTRKQWVDELTEHATNILGVALNLFRFHETGERR